MSKIEIVNVDKTPLCPHCEKELHWIERVNQGFFVATAIYICPHCNKVISIGYDR
jgi:ribosomal protein L37AE/L43A